MEAVKGTACCENIIEFGCEFFLPVTGECLGETDFFVVFLADRSLSIFAYSETFSFVSSSRLLKWVSTVSVGFLVSDNVFGNADWGSALGVSTYCGTARVFLRRSNYTRR